MEVVALVPGRDHASTRYRIAQYQTHLACVGLPLRLETLASDPRGRYEQMNRRRPDQVVFIQRKLLPIWQLLLLRRQARTLVYDFDDAVYLRDSFHPRGPYSITRAVRFHASVALADCVLAGNTYLASAAARCANAEKIHVVPTCVDPGRYQTATHDDHRPTRLVWIGSSSTLRALEEARPLLEAIGRAVPNTMLRVICDQFPRFEHLKVESAPWSSATETVDLGSADIGISWVPDDQWSRGKCGLKVLQYMAASLPVVASPVGVHEEMVQQGPGFLPACTDDWVSSIRELAANHRLRQQMGREGRDRLERNFHADIWGPVVAGRLRELAAR